MEFAKITPYQFTVLHIICTSDEASPIVIRLRITELHGFFNEQEMRAAIIHLVRSGIIESMLTHEVRHSRIIRESLFVITSEGKSLYERLRSRRRYQKSLRKRSNRASLSTRIRKSIVRLGRGMGHLLNPQTGGDWAKLIVSITIAASFISVIYKLIISYQEDPSDTIKQWISLMFVPIVIAERIVSKFSYAVILLIFAIAVYFLQKQIKILLHKALLCVFYAVYLVVVAFVGVGLWSFATILKDFLRDPVSCWVVVSSCVAAFAITILSMLAARAGSGEDLVAFAKRLTVPAVHHVFEASLTEYLVDLEYGDSTRHQRARVVYRIRIAAATASLLIDSMCVEANSRLIPHQARLWMDSFRPRPSP